MQTTATFILAALNPHLRPYVRATVASTRSGEPARPLAEPGSGSTRVSAGRR